MFVEQRSIFNEAATAAWNFDRDLCSSSSFLYLDVPISMIEDDRKRIRFRGQTVAPNSGESSSGLVSDRVPRLPGFFKSRSTRISVACKLHFITRYRRPRPQRVYRLDLPIGPKLAVFLLHFSRSPSITSAAPIVRTALVNK